MLVKLAVGIEGSWPAGDMQRIGPVEVRSTQRSGRGVPELDIQLCGRGQDAVCGGRIGQGVPTETQSVYGTRLLQWASKPLTELPRRP